MTKFTFNRQTSGATIGSIGMWMLHLVALLFMIYSAYHGIHATSTYRAASGLGNAAGILGIISIEIALAALMSMLDGYAIRQWLEKGESPTPEALFDSLFDLAWKRVDNGNYDGTFGNRAALRKLLHAAAVTPDAVDPADRALMLVDIGQVALLNYEETRRRVGDEYIRRRLASLREALAEFDAAPAVVAGNAELEQLAVYIRAAVALEEAKLAPVDAAKEAAEVADLVAELEAEIAAADAAGTY